MTDFQEIARTVYRTALIGLDWQPFGKEAALRFRDHSGKPFDIRLFGVHLLVTRHSLLGNDPGHPLNEEHWEDWEVYSFEIQSHGKFLDRFLNDDIGFASTVVLYSQNGARQGDHHFIRPLHVELVSGGGNLDAVCESVRIER